jgi:hypothetical protein
MDLTQTQGVSEAVIYVTYGEGVSRNTWLSEEISGFYSACFDRCGSPNVEIK